MWAQSRQAFTETSSLNAFKDVGYSSIFADELLPNYAIPDSLRAFTYDSIWIERLKETRSLFTLIHDTPIERELGALSEEVL